MSLSYLYEPMRIISYLQSNGAILVIVFWQVRMIIYLVSGTCKVSFKVCSELKILLYVRAGTNLIHLLHPVETRQIYSYGTQIQFRSSQCISFISQVKLLTLHGKMIVSWQQQVSLKYICGQLICQRIRLEYGKDIKAVLKVSNGTLVAIFWQALLKKIHRSWSGHPSQTSLKWS